MSVNEKFSFVTEYSELLRETCICATHPSGLTIRVVPKSTAAYAMVLATRYGSLHTAVPVGDTWVETPQGTAHFLEHQLFGTEDDERFARLGAEVNAYTSYDRTAYTASCTEHFEEVLTCLLRMVIAPAFGPETVEKERPIIAEEIRMNQDSPWDRCYANLLQAMYQRPGVRDEICGSEESVSHVTAETLTACHQAFYRPSNMVLAVSGPATPEEVWRVADSMLADVRRGAPLPTRQTKDEPCEVGRAYTVQYMPHIDDKAVFCIGVKSRTLPTDPRRRLKKEMTMTILSDMLFSRSGRFYNELFESGLIAPGFSVDTAQGQGYAMYVLTGEADAPATVFDRFCSYVKDLHRNGLPREELERSRRVLYASLVTGFDSPDDIAQSLMNDALDGVSVFDFLEVAEAITPEDLEMEFRTDFRPDAYTLSVVAAGKSEDD